MLAPGRHSGHSGAVEDIWGDTTRQQATYGVFMMVAAAALRYRMATLLGEGILSKYVKFVVAPCTALIGVAALVTAAT